MTIQQVDQKMIYTETDLGTNYTEEQTVFKLWAPKANRVTLCLYGEGQGSVAIQELWMVIGQEGVWQKQVTGDLHGMYYTYKVAYADITEEIVDPYAKAIGINGMRGMVIDLPKTNPQGWSKDAYIKLEEKTDAIIYGLDLKNFSVDPDSGVVNKAKYMAFTEENTTNKAGDATGMSHIKELGITHIHLSSIHDLKNYNVPKGEYATNSYDGEVRIKEFKQMIKAIHKQGIGIIVDVVYDYTNYAYEDLDKRTIDYFTVESILYWAKEYHIDGFKFDTTKALDVETMNHIKEELFKVNPNALLYQEGCEGTKSFADSMKLDSAASKMDKMVATLRLTSQKIPFLHAGEEIPGGNREVLEYYKGLIGLRKRYSSFRMSKIEAINKYITFIDTESQDVVAYYLGKYERNTPFVVVYNPNVQGTKLALPSGQWHIVVDKDKVNLENKEMILDSTIAVEPMSWVVLMGR